MPFFALATAAPKIRSGYIQVLSWLLVGVLATLAVAQLFTFEEFGVVIASLGLPISQSLAVVIAALIVTAEVFALPFLLRMKLSPAMRWLSLLAGYSGLLWWWAVGVWQGVAAKVAPGGYLGATVEIAGGWWSVVVMTLLLVCMGIIVWGTPDLFRLSVKRR